MVRRSYNGVEVTDRWLHLHLETNSRKIQNMCQHVPKILHAIEPGVPHPSPDAASEEGSSTTQQPTASFVPIHETSRKKRKLGKADKMGQKWQKEMKEESVRSRELIEIMKN